MTRQQLCREAADKELQLLMSGARWTHKQLFFAAACYELKGDFQEAYEPFDKAIRLLDADAIERDVYLELRGRVAGRRNRRPPR